MDILIRELYRIYRNHRKVSIDSRTIEKNAIFFALKGENYDGNSFAKNAIAKGATIAVIDNPKYKVDDKYILVRDSLQTLQDLAKYHRQQMDIPFIAISGTNGKTTTKELIKAILCQKYHTFGTKENLNNHIGVPISILSIPTEAEIAVIEMGANHIGEISLLCNITQPGFGVITNIGKAHLEGFGSIDGVIKAKSELYHFLKSNKGIVFTNHDDKLLMNLSEGNQRITYGSVNSGNYTASIQNTIPYLEILWKSPDGPIKINTKLFGDYNFYNILAAISIGEFFKVNTDLIKKGIESFSPGNNRSQVINTVSNMIFMDAYNANPTSMELAILQFDKMPAKHKVIIIGDMLELGKESHNEHKKILELIKKLKIDQVILIGEQFKSVLTDEGFIVFNDVDEAKHWIQSSCPIKNASILIKGSRKMELEKVTGVL